MAEALVDGARVRRVFEQPTGMAVQGLWSGGAWSPGEGATVRHFRDRLPLGIWRISGVDVPSGFGALPVVFLRPLAEARSIEPGDVLVLGEGLYSTLNVGSSMVPPGSAVEIGSAGYRAITEGDADQTRRLLVFHGSDAAIERTQSLRGVWRGSDVTFELDHPRFAADLDYPVEIKLNGAAVSLHRVLQTLSPVRGFVLDTGQELLYRTQRGHNAKRISGTYTYFEPLFSAEPGSLRLFIHAAKPDQIPLFVELDQPLRLFADILRAAARGDAEAVVGPLAESVFSVDELLRKVASVAETASRFGPFMVRTPDEPDGFQVTATAARVIRSGIQSLETRTLEREGILYGLDLYRNWLRLMVETDRGLEDWTLRYESSLRDQVQGQAPRNIKVRFETKSRPDMLRGTGKVIAISGSAAAPTPDRSTA